MTLQEKLDAADEDRMVNERITRESVLRKVQRELKIWQAHNFPNRPAHQPMIGVNEELGELSATILGLVASAGRMNHAYLKLQQHIRLDEDHIANLRDAIADTFVFALDFLNAMSEEYPSVNWDGEQILLETWLKVRQRDWQAHRAAHATKPEA